MRLAPIARYVLELQTGFCGAECGLFPLAWTSVEDGSIGCAESLGWPGQSLRRLTLLHFANHPQTTNYAPDPFSFLIPFPSSATGASPRATPPPSTDFSVPDTFSSFHRNNEVRPLCFPAARKHGGNAAVYFTDAKSSRT